ncbi:dTMP kinase [Anaerosolibacter carboniphilus]|uniref:Thymidylate kinase n=1 Tax=Anaerosolibacter carboniphilus TaxID=1417629 RepID=A0A841KZC1_9FIRM|nr:dTMP kinase [Anaerosolibacter carboniphilus]MBB6218707.1 dTMP kinase [Anaerosolibacter carboniphilus]
MRGLFITIEGPDGSGKTTQMKKIEEYFTAKGYEVVITREPGGTRIGEKIREIILDKNHVEMDNITEALLYAASRAQHVAEVIKPAVENGKIVICDRFVDSSLVYQGVGRNLGVALVEGINQVAIQGIMPDITFLFKLSPQIGIQRKFSQGNEDRLEREKIDFHRRVFEGYMQLEALYPQRIRGIDASRTIQEVHEEIIGHIEELLESRS